MGQFTNLAFSVSLLAMASPAVAQEVGTPESEGVDEEILVVAQKRAENVQDVPISITVASSESLARSNVTSALELGRIAPNLNVQRAAQAANVRVTIRGIGAPGNSATEPSVATFLDGIYIPRTGSVIGGFLDIESVEVLGGPQGTLFGRNASVGALSLHSATPKQDFSGSVTGEVENADRYVLKGMVNLPLNDKIAVRAAGQGRWFKGYFQNLYTNQRFGRSNEAAGRLSIKADLGSVTWIGRADYSQIKGDGSVDNEFIASSVSAAQLAGLSTALGGKLPSTDLSDRDAYYAMIGDLNDKQWGLSSTLEAEVGGGFTLKLIDSYRDWKASQADGDVVFLPVSLLNRTGQFRSKSHNHELQIISPEGELFGGALDFVGGLYYFSEKFKIGEQVHLVGQYCNIIIPVGPNRTACNTALANGAGQNSSDSQFGQSLSSFAGYTQANIHLSDQLTMVLGGRWTKEKKTGSYVQLLANPFNVLRAAENTPLTLKDDRFTYRVGLNYKPSENVMLFASYSTGYKSGGFNSGPGTPALGARRLFSRETVKDWEAGIKSEWLDRALTANLTLYRMDIAGYQDRSFDGTSFVVRNAGNLRHQGFEFDFVARPIREVRFTASVAYLDSKFTLYPGASALPGFGGGAVQDLTGGRAHFAPAWSGNFGAEWRAEVGGSGMQLVSSLNANLVSDSNIGQVTDNNPQTVQDGYVTLGGRIALVGPDERWTIALYGRNLLNEVYANSMFYQVLGGALRLNNGVFPGSTAVRAQRSDPRSYGITATFNF